jgi:glycosyltransferase involved in cell wall biosynthesis
MSAEPHVPTISVIVCSYNYGRFIAGCLDSIFAQRNVDLEVIVIDNCSTDDTLERIEPYRARPNFRFVQNPTNIGFTASMGRSLELARGEYLAWISPDDLLMPDVYARALDYYRLNPDVGVHYSGYAYMDESETTDQYVEHSGFEGCERIENRDDLLALMRHHSPICIHTVLLRREYLEALGDMWPDPEIKVAHDYFMYIQLAESGVRMAFDARPGARIRLHKSNASGMGNFFETGLKAREFIRIAEWLSERPGLRPIIAGMGMIFLARVMDDLNLLPEIRDSVLASHGERLAATRTRFTAVAQQQPEIPTVSVIVASRGDLRLLRPTLDSLAAQTHPAIEIIVAATAGATELDAIIDPLPYASRIAWFRMRTSHTMGAARNSALRMARGDVIAHLEEGDMAAPTHVAQLVSLLATTKMPVAAVPATVILEHLSVGYAPPRAEVANIKLPHRTAGWASLIECATPLSSIAHVRGFADTLDGFNETLPMYDDWDFVMRAARASSAATGSESTVTVRYRLMPMPDFITKWEAAVASIRYIHSLTEQFAAGPTAEVRTIWLAELERRVAIAKTKPGAVKETFEALLALHTLNLAVELVGA